MNRRRAVNISGPKRGRPSFQDLGHIGNLPKLLETQGHISKIFEVLPLKHRYVHDRGNVVPVLGLRFGFFQWTSVLLNDVIAPIIHNEQYISSCVELKLTELFRTS